jgi:8-oxo-dGTP diphosphatase
VAAGGRGARAVSPRPYAFELVRAATLTFTRGGEPGLDLDRVTAHAELTYRWHEAPAAGHLEVAKVHGFLVCPGTGRALVQEFCESSSLPGGSPEPADPDLAAALAREALEESQVIVTGMADLGYQEVREPGRAPYAQARMAGQIARFLPRRPDSDSGRLLRRFMCPLTDVPAVLGWGTCDGDTGGPGRADRPDALARSGRRPSAGRLRRLIP